MGLDLTALTCGSVPNRRWVFVEGITVRQLLVSRRSRTANATREQDLTVVPCERVGTKPLVQHPDSWDHASKTACVACRDA